MYILFYLFRDLKLNLYYLSKYFKKMRKGDRKELIILCYSRLHWFVCMCVKDLLEHRDEKGCPIFIVYSQSCCCQFFSVSKSPFFTSSLCELFARKILVSKQTFTPTHTHKHWWWWWIYKTCLSVCVMTNWPPSA